MCVNFNVSIKKHIFSGLQLFGLRGEKACQAFVSSNRALVSGPEGDAEAAILEIYRLYCLVMGSLKGLQRIDLASKPSVSLRNSGITHEPSLLVLVIGGENDRAAAVGSRKLAGRQLLGQLSPKSDACGLWPLL